MRVDLFASTSQRHVKNDCLLVPEYCGNGCGEQIAREDVSDAWDAWHTCITIANCVCGHVHDVNQ